jgi:hypothetical protein
MASLRKRYQSRVEGLSDKDAPVTSTPVQAAEPPPVSDAPKPVEPLEKDDPAEDAAASALKRRLREMEDAERLVKVAHQEPRMAGDPQQDPLEAFLASIPKAASDWLRAHSEYMHDPEKNAALQHCHWNAKRETGEEFTPKYIASLERHLGLRREPTRAEILAHLERTTNAHVTRSSHTTASPPPVRTAPVSAPPHRDPPSMSSGRPASTPLHLTQEQRELARSLGLTDEQYRDGLRRMNSEKAAGLHQNGR